MRFVSFLKISCFVCFFLFAIYRIPLYADPLIHQNFQHDFPSLIDSIHFKKDIQFCGIKVPLENQDVKERLEKEMLLILWNRPQVILWIKRAAKFFPHVEHILKQQNLPLDLKYVPLIESALRPHARSSKGAVGYWQFLRSTGRHYGLKIDRRIDERRNIFKSTLAACRYFKVLKEQFGSYLLAMSAFNMGEYGLKAAINAQKTHDFFSLYLPLQTQRYIFRAVCAKLILENQSFYGFHLKKSDLYPVFAFDRVKISPDFQIPITLVANAADISFKTIKDYNPELRGYYLNKGKATILVPEGKANRFNRNFAAAYNQWKKTEKMRFHIVRKGESLTEIAKRYRLSLASLLKLNNFSLKKIIHPGDRLLIE